MSYQNQPLPPQNQQSPAPTAIQHQNVAPPLANHFPNGPSTMYAAGLKQQYLPPQIHTNGLDNSRNMSPGLSQPLNAAHLPPINRPNVYAPTNVSNANMKPPSLVSPISSNPQIQAPTQMKPPMVTPSTLSSQPPPPSTMNYYQTQQPQIVKPISGPPVVNVSTNNASIPNNLSVDKVTSNLQNVHLNNGNGIQSPTQPLQNQIPGGHSPHIITNRLTNGNSSQPHQTSPTIPGLNMPPQKSITPNLAPPLTNKYAVPQNQNLNQNQIPFVPAQQQQQYQHQPPPQQQQQQQHQVPQQQPPQFNGIPGKFPPMNQPPQTQLQNAAMPPMNLPPSNSNIGKRPMYPSQPPQQQQQQQQPSPINNTINSTYNQYQQPPMPQPATLNNQPYAQQPQSIVQRGFDSMWGHNTVDLMQHRHILPTTPVEPPKISLEHQFYESVNCSPECVFYPYNFNYF